MSSSTGIGVSPLTDSLQLLAEVNPDVHAQPDGVQHQQAQSLDEHAITTTTATTASVTSAPSSASSSASATPSVPSSSPIEKAGWMQKNSYDSPNVFNNYYFVLQDNQLRYFVSEEVSQRRRHTGCVCL